MKTWNLSKIIISIVFVLTVSFSFAQMQGPGDPGGEPVGKPPVGGGAPVGGGIIFLLALGAIYGSKKVVHLVKDASFTKQK